MDSLKSLRASVEAEIRALKRCLDGLPPDSLSRDVFSSQLMAYSVVLGFIHDEEQKILQS